jgi:glycogen debranching enzyme
MVVDYYELTEDREFLEEILPSVERELEWWRKNRTVQVRLGKEEYTAYIYRVKGEQI